MSGQHGFARTVRWTLAEHSEASATLTLSHSEHTLSQWPHQFILRYNVALAHDTLTTSLEIENTDTCAFQFTSLLHTYFRIADIRATSIVGVVGLDYLDKLRDHARCHETRREIIGIDAEIDRNYLDVSGGVLIGSPNGRFELASNFKDLGTDAQSMRNRLLKCLVVWNPWSDKAKAMADFADDEVWQWESLSDCSSFLVH